MISRFREIENSYIESFSSSVDNDSHIVFSDERLPDMHAFNCIFIKENMEKSLIPDFVKKSLAEAKLEGKDFLKIIIHPKITADDHLKELLQDMGFQVQTNLYMRIDGKKAESFSSNAEGSVKMPDTEEEFEQGRKLDIETSIRAGMPSDFAHRKALRKKEVFLDTQRKLFSYLCYYQGTPIGKCEFFTKDGYGKIEDFDVLEKYQRRGFGTAILKKVISDAMNNGIENIYLITGKEDTPREMYSKLGFEIIGEEVEIFWGE